MSFNFHSQEERQIDSVKNIIKNGPDDTVKVNALLLMCANTDYKTGIAHGEHALALSQKLKHKAGVLQSMQFIAKLNFLLGDKDKAIFYYTKLLEDAEKRGDPLLKAEKLNDLAIIYNSSGNISEALNYHHQSLKLKRQLNNKKGIAFSLNSLGIIYDDQGDIPKALDHYHESLKLLEEIKDDDGVALILNNIATVYKQQGDHLKALECYNKSLKLESKDKKSEDYARLLTNMGILYSEMDSAQKALALMEEGLVIRKLKAGKNSIANSYGNLGSIYAQMGNMTKAKEYIMESLSLRQQIGEKADIGKSYNQLAGFYFMGKNFKEAEAYGIKGLAIAKELGNVGSMLNAAKKLSDIYPALGKYKEAYEMHVLYKRMSDSIIKETNKKSLFKKEMQHEYEKKEAGVKVAAKMENDKIQALASEEQRRKNLIIGAVCVVLILLLIFSSFIYKSLRENKEKNKIITEQKHFVEEKQKEIVDSINYAKRIQEAILPAKELKYRIFPDAFVLFKPKDIVSGDFYWFAEKNNKRLIAAVDCTGHGVPGAFMSMIGNTFLNDIVNVKGITEPGRILDHLREQVITSLKQSGGENKDGMDISILAVSYTDNGEQTVEWAGANNPLWMIRNGECHEYKANKQPVGYYVGDALPFTNNIIKTKKDDVFYIFTDGFADQFGGEKGKKFKYKNLKDILIALHSKPMPEQEQFLLNTFNDWKHSLEQIDDVCIIGLRV